MSNHPLLHYKPGITLDTPITVTMSAGDWVAYMAWHAGLQQGIENGVYHLTYGIIAPQVSEALYTKDSVRAAEASVHQQQQQAMGPFGQMFGFPQTPEPDDFHTQILFCVSCQNPTNDPPGPLCAIPERHEGP